MAHLQHFNPSFSFEPALAPNTKITMSASSYNLCMKGMNIPVQITSVPLEKDKEPKSVSVLAHLDTGAFTTCIDEKLATALELPVAGLVKIQTESGFKNANKYIIGISFPNTGLRGYTSYAAGCDLAYKGNVSNLNPNNFSILIGRDIMSNWNIVYNGPTSSVFISD
jgi:hypothetical protein